MRDVPIAVIGGGGYVAGEAVRLLIGHPRFDLVALTSATNQGTAIGQVFPHLSGPQSGLRLSSNYDLMEMITKGEVKGVVSALPHGESKQVLEMVRATSALVPIVDLGSDMRFAPGWTTGVSELSPDPIGDSVAHPGCFSTCSTLATAPLAASGWGIQKVTVFGVTGSTGSGRTPKATTHHPERHSGFWAYDPLRHRHSAEITQMLAALGTPLDISFVPHSAPLSRGMHVTVVANASRPLKRDEVLEQLQAYYSACPLVTVREDFPSVKDVVGSNRCHIGATCQDEQVVVVSVIDNLVKGAAGGGLQFLNRMLGLDETTGLDGTALGWN